MDREGELSSDDSLSKPAPIPAHLFRKGPITLKSYRAACERTPAQPRRSRGSHIRASITEEDNCSSVNIMEAMQKRPAVTESRVQTEGRAHPRRESIYNIPASQDSDLNRSPTSSPEPADDIDRITAFAPRPGQQLAEPKQKNSIILGGDPLARLFKMKKKVKKRYIARRSSPLTSKTSPMSSETEETPTITPYKKHPRKKRKLPIEHELVMVPYLGFRESQDTASLVESDPIEETQAALPIRTKRATRAPSQSRRQPLQSIQKNLRVSIPKKSLVPDAFSFRALEDSLPIAKLPLKHLAREGFDDHELVLPQKIKRKKVSSRSPYPSIPTLTLINARDDKDCPMSSPPWVVQQAKYLTPEMDSTQPSPELLKQSPFIEFEPLPEDDELQDSTMLSPLKAIDMLSETQSNTGLKRLQRVSFCDKVQSQLLSVTAPTRETSDSGDDSEEYESPSPETESGSEPDESDEEEFEEIGFDTARTANGNNGAEFDEIQDEELLLETANNAMEKHTETTMNVDHGNEPYLTRPGQLARMKSSGRLNEVPEDCIEVHSSSNPANSVPGFLARYHSSVTEPVSTRTLKPLKSILKSIISTFRTSIHSTLTHSSFRSRRCQTITSYATRVSKYSFPRLEYLPFCLC